MLATACIAAQYAGTLDLSDTTRASARLNTEAIVAAGQTPGTAPVAIDLTTTPVLRASLSDRTFNYSLSYSPAFTAFGVNAPGTTLLIMQTGTARADWHNRTLKLGVSEIAGGGQFNSSLLSPLPGAQGPGGTQPTTGTAGGAQPPTGPSSVPSLAVPQPTTVDVASYDTSASALASLSRILTMGLSGGFAVSGGANTEALHVLPRQDTVHALANGDYALSLRDGLVTTVNAFDTNTTGPCFVPPSSGASSALPPASSTSNSAAPICATQSEIISPAETWRHAISRTTNVSVGAGVAVGLVRPQGAPSETIVYPVGAVTLDSNLDGTPPPSEPSQTMRPETSPDRTSTFAFSARLAPVVDILTGYVDDRAVGLTTLTVHPAPALTTSFNASAFRSVPVPPLYPYPITGVSGGVNAGFQLDPSVELQFGALALWQHQSGFVGSGTIASAIGYLGVLARAPTADF